MNGNMARHLLATVSAHPNILNNPSKLEEVALRACKDGGATVIKSESHAFEPQGVTMFVILAESHFSIHTWPELGKACLDIFTCGDEANPFKIFTCFCQAIDAKRDSWHLAPRPIVTVEKPAQRRDHSWLD